MTPAEEGAIVIIHYMRELSAAAGRGWSKENSRDILRAVRLIATSESEMQTPDGPPAIPTFNPARASTVHLRRDDFDTNDDDRAYLRGLQSNWSSNGKAGQ